MVVLVGWEEEEVGREFVGCKVGEHGRSFGAAD
jgi:hypothetical protein